MTGQRELPNEHSDLDRVDARLNTTQDAGGIVESGVEGVPNTFLWGAVCVLVLGMGSFCAFSDAIREVRRPFPEFHKAASVVAAEDHVLLPQSASRLEVMTPEKLDMVGRNHMFSFMDVARQKRVISHSKAVISRYPDYPGSYATAAHSLSSIAIVTRGSGRAQGVLREAQAMLDLAVERGADDPWTLSAAGWTAFGAGRWEEAKNLSLQAYRSEGGDRRILIFHALILLFMGEFEQVLEVTQPAADAPGQGNPAIYGFAAFELGNYQSALEAFELALNRGVEQNAVRASFLAASYEAVGRHKEATKLVGEIRRQWPTFQPERVHAVFMTGVSEDYGQRYLRLFQAAGWRSDA
ncbi:tetratricopeptide repeat protein [Shimia sp. R11_0]|uniref:tetratricopeptide repeat protein n=1 Tax=Shimia sp. R11_0 TaxID=2821096 RepID=UPI001ADC4989|nr:tetratricopeptide repeat protein [Shimia sp. R11_0]MBO9476481.1 tetratricopeptide repeat protein [Shimia sp. R11_0]